MNQIAKIELFGATRFRVDLRCLASVEADAAEERIFFQPKVDFKVLLSIFAIDQRLEKAHKS
jgi:hypothetical protein